MTVAPLLKTALHPEHVRLGARMVSFTGWEMPIQYRGIVEEHTAVRRAAGMFDVSHMNRTRLTGPDAGRLLRRALTYDVLALEPGRGHYTLMCNEEGGILDDPYVYRSGGERWLFVGNAANAERDVARLRSLVRPEDSVEVEDIQRSTVMIALQGPQAVETFLGAVSEEARGIAKRRCAEIPFAGGTLFVSRTGYTGEDGLELVTDSERGVRLWRLLLEAGVAPCGLGARDTLRLEACLALYGNDIDESMNPFEAGLGWVVTLDDGADFAGREALLRLKEREPERLLTPVKATERAVFRAHYPVLLDGMQVGQLASGGFSPTVGAGIGLAYLPRQLSVVGTMLQVDVRGRAVPAVVVPRPFYRRREATPP